MRFSKTSPNEVFGCIISCFLLENMIAVIIFISVLVCVSARNEFPGGWDYFKDGTESDAVKVANINAQSARDVGEINMKIVEKNMEMVEKNMALAKMNQQSALDIEWKRFRYNLCLSIVQYTIAFVMVTVFGVCIRDGLTGKVTDIDKFLRSLDPTKILRRAVMLLSSSAVIVKVTSRATDYIVNGWRCIQRKLLGK